jgi:hypothetical protein
MQLLEEVNARVEMQTVWPTECFALWRLAERAKAMAEELEVPGRPFGAQFLARGGHEADRDLVGQEACSLLREVFGNPLHAVTLAPAWRSAVVEDLATAAYGNPQESVGNLDTDALAVLSDALEEAGCTDTNILEHLRSPGPHVRGCWALDLILDKQ